MERDTIVRVRYTCTNEQEKALNRADIQVQSGNYSSWRENFDRLQQFEEAKNDRLQKEVRRLQQAARRTSAWSDRVEASKIGA